jgi:hypothetical protein
MKSLLVRRSLHCSKIGWEKANSPVQLDFIPIQEIPFARADQTGPPLLCKPKLPVMESKLHGEDYSRLVSSFGINVTKELMILNHSAYENSLDVLRESRIVNLDRIKYFVGAKTSRDTLKFTH